MKRYYCPEWCHRTKGWIELPMLASLKESEANRASETFAKEHCVATRVQRKPHGWTPENSKYNLRENRILPAYKEPEMGSPEQAACRCGYDHVTEYDQAIGWHSTVEPDDAERWMKEF